MKLSPKHRTTWPEPLLREFAREVLGAQRISADYLEALRVVLGNQAHADEIGAQLELNMRVDFATERTMRTLLDQMKAAGITAATLKGLGAGRVQRVSVYSGSNTVQRLSLDQAYRRQEDRDDDAQEKAMRSWDGQTAVTALEARRQQLAELGISDDIVPF